MVGRSGSVGASEAIFIMEGFEIGLDVFISIAFVVLIAFVGGSAPS